MFQASKQRAQGRVLTPCHHNARAAPLLADVGGKATTNISLGGLKWCSATDVHSVEDGAHHLSLCWNPCGHRPQLVTPSIAEKPFPKQQTSLLSCIIKILPG